MTDRNARRGREILPDISARGFYTADRQDLH